MSAEKTAEPKPINAHLPENNEEFDYIVVGGGTGACTVAGRLSEHKHVRVLVLERGIDVSNDPTVKPTSYGLELPTVPTPFTPVESLFVGPDPNLLAQKGFNLEYAAKCWGGGPAISGSFWGRGDPANYDEWAALGNKGWDYNSCLPFFKLSEHFKFVFDPKIPVSNERGLTGPVGAGSLSVDPPNERPFRDPFVSTFGGQVLTDASTSAGQYGLGPMVRSLGLDPANPVRNTTYTQYVRPFLATRKNLHAVELATVTHILFEKKAGAAKPRAHGVQYSVNGKSYIARAKKEVIVGLGTIGSPKLLLQSGVGAADELAKWGIASVANLPGVGKNMTNHYNIGFSAPISTSVFPTPQMPDNGACIGFLKSSVFAGKLAERAKSMTAPAGAATTAAAAAVKGGSPADAKVPDAKNDGLIDIELSWAVAPLPGSTPNTILGFIADLRAEYRGIVSLKSADPFAQPSIMYFTPGKPTPTPGINPASPDVQKLVTAFRLLRSWLLDTGLCPANAPDLNPSLATVPLDATDAQWTAWIMSQFCGLYHWASTCKMGPASDPLAVVDAELRVHGVDGLRVADCSVMPLVVTCHPSASAVMIGERLAYWLEGWAPSADPALKPAAAATATAAAK